MRAFAFTVKSYMGHFRRYDSTTSSLTYAFPPKTTIQGILAGALGINRDSYYSLLTGLDIGVSVLKPFRKMFFKLNLTDTDELKNILHGVNTQVNREYLMPARGNDFIEYRVYVGEGKNPAFFSKLHEAFSEGRSKIPISLGSTECLATISEFRALTYEPYTGTAAIHSVIPREALHVIQDSPVAHRIYFEYSVPAEFDDNRHPKTRDYAYTIGEPITAELQCSKINSEEGYICFL